MTQVTERPKSKRTRHPRRNRGILLTIWIALIGVFGAVTAVLAVRDSSALGLATSLFLFLCAWGLWKWQRWAYFSLLVAFAVAAAVLLVALLTTTENLPVFVIALVALVVTVVLVQPRLDEFR